VTPGGCGGSGNPRLVDAYEAMRQRRGSGRPGTVGYELVRRQGMAAWIQAFSACVGAPESPAPDGRAGVAALPRRAAARPATAEASGWVPLSLYPEVTRLLAGLALGPLREGLR